jgi:protein gp37
MAESSAIEWTDATVNFWWGCTKVGPGCDHCYAETWNKFRGNGLWGAGAPRRWVKSAVATIHKLERDHGRFLAAHGRRRRVFIQSMSDTFDNEVDQVWRDVAFAEIENAIHLDVQLLTKRVPNVDKMVPAAWRSGYWPRHVGLMITVVNQMEVARDVPRLIELKNRFNIPWIGLSCEPLRAWLDLSQLLADLDWIIVGGESGRHARQIDADAIRAIRDQCAAAGTPFLFKQWGKYVPTSDANGPYMMWAGKKAAGRVLDGRTHDEFPRIAA